jgi:hypothetical protein
MPYRHHLFRFAWIFLLVGILGLKNSAFAGGFSTGSSAGQLYQVAGKLTSWRGLWVLPAASSGRTGSFPIWPLAYVDPGSGQLVWQMLLAGCVGTLFYVKRIRAFLARQLGKWFKKKE